MKFKEGDKVEVFSKEEFVMGAWRCAEIISSYGDMCLVKYGLFPLISGSESVVDRVPKEAVRPCPPPVEEESYWVKDDVIEVLDDFSWKRVRVVKAADDNTFVVRLFGLCEGFRVHKSYLRDRQCWKDGTWFPMGRKFGQPMRKKIPYTWTKHMSASEKNDEILKPCIGSKRRRSTHSKLVECHPVDSIKKRSIEKNGIYHQILSVHPSPAYSSVIEPYIYVDSDSCSSSVGSCTVTSSDPWNRSFGISKHMNDEEEFSSDAESTCALEYPGKGCSRKTSLEGHWLELHTYFSEVRTLYSLGPLHWKDEERLTDMRNLLHISTDEHLMVVRELISSNCSALAR